MLVQAYQGLGQHAKALPLAERYVQANPKAGDTGCSSRSPAMPNSNAIRPPNAGNRNSCCAIPIRSRPGGSSPAFSSWPVPRIARWPPYGRRTPRGCASLRPSWTTRSHWPVPPASRQGAKLLEGMLASRLLPSNAQRQERMGMLWWQARERTEAAKIYRQLATQTGSAKFWMNVAQLELEQARWQAGLEALKQAERAGAERRRVREWREWAEGELSFERERQVASVR